MDREESAGSPYELNQLLPISLGPLRTVRAGKGGAEREGPTCLVQVKDGSGVEGRPLNGGRGEGTRRSKRRKGNVWKGVVTAFPLLALPLPTSLLSLPSTAPSTLSSPRMPTSALLTSPIYLGTPLLNSQYIRIYIDYLLPA